MRSGHTRFRSGNSLIEYGLISLCGILIMVPATLFLGGNLQKMFQKMRQEMLVRPVQPVLPQPVAVKPVSPSPQPAPGTTDLTLTLENGESVVLGNYPNDIAAAIVTLGTNGTTMLLCKTLQLLAERLREKGVISPHSEGALINLAQQGHEIGQMEQFMEENLKNAKSLSDLANKAVTYKGERYANLSRMSEHMDIGSDGESVVIGKMTELYHQAEKEGALREASVKAVVSELVNNIKVVSDLLAKNTKSALKNDKSTFQAIEKNIASTLSHRYSTGICTVAQGRDTGVQCYQK